MKLTRPRPPYNVDWSSKNLESWGTIIGFSTPGMVKETLKHTIQLMIVEEENMSYTIMQRHFKIDYN